MYRVLVTNLMMQRDAAQYQDQLIRAGIELEHYPVQQFLTESELQPILGKFDGIIAGDDQLTRRVLESARPRLKVISKWGVGLDSVDLQAAKELGIKVFNSPGAFGGAVSEVAVGYLIMLSRHLHHTDRAVRLNQWPKLEGEGLGGRTVGIIGFGEIGQAIACRLLAFGSNLIACDPHSGEIGPVQGVQYAPLETLLPQSDYVCLACDLNDTNVHLINARTIRLMKQGAGLVNVARGALVDEPALVDALLDGRLSGAALDVYEVEPLPVGSALKQLHQVILGSHNANNLTTANARVNANSVRNLIIGLQRP